MNQKLCENCGGPLKFKWQKKFCSHKCKGEGRAIQNKPCSDCGALKKTKRSLRCKPCENKNSSKRQKKLAIDPRVYSNEKSEKLRIAGIIKSLEARKLSGNLFNPKKADCHRRFSQKHVKAVECFFRDPRNVVHYCKNISAFVWHNKFLFNPEDVEEKIYGLKKTKSYVCNAIQGLSKLYRGRCGVWKGWMLVENREGRERFDLIGRNFYPTSSSSDQATFQPTQVPASLPLGSALSS